MYYDDWNYEYVPAGKNNYIRTLEGSGFFTEETVSRKKIYDKITETLKTKLAGSGEKTVCTAYIHQMRMTLI